MKKSVRTAATAVLAAPLLAAVFAAPASAAPHDVTLSAAVEGSDFTVTIVNDSPNQVECDWFAMSSTSSTDELTSGGFVRSDADADCTKRNVADGNCEVTWSCADRDGGQWGTDGLSDPATAQPFKFTVGEQQGGSGSLGSLDFGSFGSGS
ncbi:hypothetical protein [Rhodococcus marinonascens]|uniref:hypothetical protein n=1 Tax=Rhodococcus marinonascens TaxID=38311 RepID=UPI000A88D98C|nr:hypothetical protein [Rhodococcus marinonascens]